MAVAFNQNADQLGSHAERQGYAGVFTEGPASLVRDYNIRAQSSWVGIGRDGAILNRRGYGRDGASFWRGILDALRSS